MIPYGRQEIAEDDIQAVVETLRSPWLTTGPKVEEFESAIAEYVGAKYAVAVSSGTAALHVATNALNIGATDEVIVPAMTFAASANCVVYQGGRPVFADVDPATLLLDPKSVEAKITSRTKAIIAVDYAGQACDYDELKNIADKHGLALVDDACHALGGKYKNSMVGSLLDLNVFSFHPVKHITTGEGGLVTTNDENLASRMRAFRNHGISSDHRQREKEGSWFYEMSDLGYNYRLTDIQCVLGISQLKKLPAWIERRQAIARYYDDAFSNITGIEPLALREDVSHAYHLYVVRVNEAEFGCSRARLFKHLRDNGIGANVHYIPVHLHPFYRERFGYGPGLCPNAEKAYESILSLPMYPGLSKDDCGTVVNVLGDISKGKKS